LPLEKLEKKEGLLCILAVEGDTLMGFKLGYPHPDGLFYLDSSENATSIGDGMNGMNAQLFSLI